MPDTPAAAADLLVAWRAAGHARWFARDDAFDATLRTRFGELVCAAATGALGDWAATAPGALALVLLTDQLPRNLHRGSAQAFAADPIARATADAAIVRGYDLAVEAELRPFFYMPCEHAESAPQQARSVALFTRYAVEAGDPHDFLRYAFVHQDVIRRFGRFPHRNAALGRITTEAERRFLEGGGFRG